MAPGARTATSATTVSARVARMVVRVRFIFAPPRKAEVLRCARDRSTPAPETPPCEGPTQDGGGTSLSQPFEGLVACAATEPSQDREVPVDLVGGHVRLEPVPLRALVAYEEFVNMLAQYLPEDVRALGQRDRVGEILWERGDADGFPLGGGHLVDVVR